MDAETRTPHYEKRETKWDVGDLVNRRVYDPLNSEGEVKETLLYDENQRMLAQNIKNSPSWQISIYTLDAGQQGPVYLVIAVDHVLTDGRGR